MLYKHGFITRRDVEMFCLRGGILGEHPDSTKIPGVEACTGSLGHGFPFSAGLALALKAAGRNNRVVTLIGDGEANEGTVWETALVGAHRRLGNLCVVADLNGSSEQVLSLGDFAAKWRAFGWDTFEIDGHDEGAIDRTFRGLQFAIDGTPKAIVAHTLKGKGVAMTEGHGTWHHRIPNEEEYAALMRALA